LEAVQLPAPNPYAATTVAVSASLTIQGHDFIYKAAEPDLRRQLLSVASGATFAGFLIPSEHR
jgi:hypothetical protein